MLQNYVSIALLAFLYGHFVACRLPGDQVNMTNSELYPAIFSWFNAIPKESPAVVALVMYFAVGCANLYVTIKTKAWFMLIVAFTAGLEIGGYACRVIMLYHPAYDPYVIMQALLIISPIFLALVDYNATGKLMQRANIKRVCLKPVWIARLFFASDIFCLAVQGGGAGMASSLNTSVQQTAKTLLLLGLALQLVFFSLFAAITLHIHRSRKYSLRGDCQYRGAFFCLYSTIALMYIRNIYRLIEFSGGFRGTIASNETYFYIFDFTMIWLCFLLFTICHFGFCLKPDESLISISHAGLAPKGANTDCGVAGVHALDNEMQTIEEL